MSLSPLPDNLYTDMDSRSSLAPKIPTTQSARSATFSEWCEVTSCHGVIDWYRNHSIGRWFWAILILAFAGVAIWQIHGLVDYWTTYPHYVTNVFLKPDEYSEFPNITICNLNRVNYTKATSHPWYMTNDAISYLFLSLMSQYEISSAVPLKVDGKRVMPEDFIKQVKAWAEFWPRAQELNITNIDQLFYELGHNCEGSFCMCTFGGIPFDCCSNAVATLNGEFGLCWTITPPIKKGDSTPKQFFPGVMQGFRAWVQPGTKFYSSNIIYNNFIQQGIVVAANFQPATTWYVDRLIVSPGTRASVQLANNIYTYKKPLFQIHDTDCSHKEENEFSKGNYSVMNCVADCVQKLAIDGCDCMIVGEVRKKIKKFCTPDQMVRCVFAKFGQGMDSSEGAGNGEWNIGSCMSSCKSPCANRKEVKMTASISAYPSHEQVQLLVEYYKKNAAAIFGEDAAAMMYGQTKAEDENFIKSWIALDMYYTDRGYTVIESEAKVTIFTLIGNIGGQLGLWLGVSILTLIQAFYYLMKFLTTGCSRRVSP